MNSPQAVGPNGRVILASTSGQTYPVMPGVGWGLADGVSWSTADPALVTSGWVTTDEAVPDATGAETAGDGAMPPAVSCERSSRPPSTAMIITAPRTKTGGIRELAWRRRKSQANSRIPPVFVLGAV